MDPSFRDQEEGENSLPAVHSFGLIHGGLPEPLSPKPPPGRPPAQSWELQSHTRGHGITWGLSDVSSPGEGKRLLPGHLLDRGHQQDRPSTQGDLELHRVLSFIYEHVIESSHPLPPQPWSPHLCPQEGEKRGATHLPT